MHCSFSKNAKELRKLQNERLVMDEVLHLKISSFVQEVQEIGSRFDDWAAELPASVKGLGSLQGRALGAWMYARLDMLLDWSAECMVDIPQARSRSDWSLVKMLCEAQLSAHTMKDQLERELKND